MRSIFLRTFLSIAGTVLCLPTIIAADGNSTAKQPDVNTTLFTLVAIMLILLLIIGILAYVLQQLGVVIKEKNRKEANEKDNKAKGIISALLIACIFPFTAHASDAGTTPDLSKAYQFPTTIDGLAFADFCILSTIILLQLFVIFMLARNLSLLLKALKGEQETGPTVAQKAPSPFWDKFNNARSIETEKEILLDHNYDGIQELDNSLPPWWKYGFYLTILVSFIYIYRFHVAHTGLSQDEEFAAEMQRGEEEKAAYLAQSANNVDESNVVALTDAMAIAAGKEIFVKNCAACHLADGGGSVGPNLTDDYWLHGGSIQDVFRSVKYGWQDKGMKSWKDDLSPVQIQQVSSFIRSLKGTTPAAPKAPQGDLYVEVTKTDSAAVAK